MRIITFVTDYDRIALSVESFVLYTNLNITITKAAAMPPLLFLNINDKNRQLSFPSTRNQRIQMRVVAGSEIFALNEFS